MPNCLVCQTTYQPFMSFGPMPIANGFLTPDQFKDEIFFELEVGFCPHCTMVQLAHFPAREQMFHENYAYFSSMSTRMAAHFQSLAQQVMVKHLHSADNPFVVEIGSNDGILLQHFAQAHIRHLGLEPSANVAEAARSKGVNTFCAFFDEAVASQVVEEYGRADAILGANVMCHIPYLNSVVAGVKQLLKPGGVLIFEDPYLGDILTKTAYDQIYDEHAVYFSLKSVTYLFEKQGLEVVDVESQPVHGGSMRYTIAHKGSRTVSPNVERLRKQEEALAFTRPETYQHFRCQVEHSRRELLALLRGLKKKGERVVGYGATSKSTTVTNYCGLTAELIDYISDTTPTKQHKFSPGTHIPVLPYSEFLKDQPNYVLLFAWNHANEILAKEKGFLEKGGTFITYVSTVKFLEAPPLDIQDGI